MHCHVCDKLIRSDATNIPVLKGFEVEGFPEEQLELCQKCADQFNALLKKCKTKKQRERLWKEWLKKASEA